VPTTCEGKVAHEILYHRRGATTPRGSSPVDAIRRLIIEGRPRAWSNATTLYHRIKIAMLCALAKPAAVNSPPARMSAQRGAGTRAQGPRKTKIGEKRFFRFPLPLDGEG